MRHGGRLAFDRFSNALNAIWMSGPGDVQGAV